MTTIKGYDKWIILTINACLNLAFLRYMKLYFSKFDSSDVPKRDTITRKTKRGRDQKDFASP
jgi:hypothetical protein